MLLADTCSPGGVGQHHVRRFKLRSIADSAIISPYVFYVLAATAGVKQTETAVLTTASGTSV